MAMLTGELAPAAITIAPTRMMPWIALVPAHQRGVQDRRHLGDDLDADEDRQHEKGQLVE